MRPLMITRLLCITAVLCALSGHTQATPFTPSHDDEVVEVLRERPLSAQEKQWRQLRAQARAEPFNAILAAQVARQAIDWSRHDGDPRLMGQAQAALSIWWQQPNPPADIRLLRATILQSTHDFDAALRDLQALVKAQPNNAQAWLTLASVLQVTGQYASARTACDGLQQAHATWHHQVCQLELASLQGQAVRAQAGLNLLAQRAPADLTAYINLVRAELAERLGQASEAETLYQGLLAQDADAYTEGAYADLLLDQHRPQDAIARLQRWQRNDSLLLRLAQAYVATNDARATQAIQALRARFAAAHARGDNVHRREEARFTLHLLKQPDKALKLAVANWQVQKEPADARILLEAALAAHEPEAAAPARLFIQQSGWADKRLEGLL